MAELAQVLRQLAPVTDGRALAHAASGDDAAVYLIDGGRAVVVTVDFFTPIVDDPFDFGRIAATNALSDLYAMGATPLFALNLVAFPRNLLSEGILDEILRGSAEVTRAAGVPVLGGHSIDDAEPKFGMVAVGEVHPARMITNRGARPGDVLVLTKPLGTGIVSTAIKADAATAALTAEAVRWMTTLNRDAALAMSAAGVHAATDVTGYGLLGHLHNIVRESDVSARLRVGDIPFLPGVLELIAAGHVPGGTQRNLEDLMEVTTFDSDVALAERTLLADAQTSGGILAALPEEAAERMLEQLGPGKGWVIGVIEAGPPGSIQITR